MAPRSVLVLDCDERSGLTVTRSLGRAGITVDIGWPTQRSAIKSRYVRNIVDLPNPNDASEAWLDALKSLLVEYKYDLIIPCSDRAIIPIQKHKIEIGKFARVYALSDRAFISTFDKYQTTLLAEQCKIPIPRWALVRTQQEIVTTCEAFECPVVLKPIWSFTRERRGVEIIQSKRDLASTLEVMLPNGPVLI